MVLLTVDGRMVDSRGLTEKELARLMLDLGADDVLNLDGGGSSTMLERSPGEARSEVVNKPVRRRRTVDPERPRTPSQ